MTDFAHQRSPDNRAAEEAAAWVLRADRGLTAVEQDDFSSWLAANPQHGRAFARMRRSWQGLDVLAGWRPEHSAQPNPDLLKPPAKAARNWIPLSALAATLSMILVVDVSLSVHDAPARTARAAPATVVVAPATGPLRLDDGTIVELNRGAEVNVQYTPAERRVRLVRGEAHFAVHKDSARPFVVEVGGLDVRAIGTAFNVRFAPADVEVLVTEGRVDIERAHAMAIDPAARDPHSPDGTTESLVRALEPRQRAVIPLTDRTRPPQIATLTAGEIERVLSWQDRMLDFTATPLHEVVAQFNRRNVVQLVLDDPRLASERISGAFRSDNLLGFVHLLEAGFGAKAEQRGDEIVLRSAK